MRRVLTAASATALCLFTACGGGSPTTPDRHGEIQVYIVCDGISGSATACRAPIDCNLYPCADGTPSDVTQMATWTVDDSSVATIIGPGLVKSVGVGNTLLRVRWSYSNYFIPIAVFAGTVPLPTYEYEGTIYDGGATTRTTLDGALVEIVTGLVAGRNTTSGSVPDAFPGGIPHASPGYFAFFGVPAGTYRLRVSKAGFVTQEFDTSTGFMQVTLIRD